jgi:purine-binding chemotaxis protein CheW
MDILAARKKAAEQTKARQQPDPETAPPADAAPATETAQAEVVVAPPSLEPPARVSAAPPAPQPAVTPSAAPEAAAEGPKLKEVELLSFLLGSEEYVVMVEDVREVLKVRDRTLVPNAPAHILGVASLRGTMLPIVDLSKRLGLATGPGGDKARIVVVKAGDEQVGILVDRVTGVLRISPDEIKPAPENVEQGAEYLRGIVRKNDKLYILLDLEKAVIG